MQWISPQALKQVEGDPQEAAARSQLVESVRTAAQEYREEMTSGRHNNQEQALRAYAEKTIARAKPEASASESAQLRSRATQLLTNLQLQTQRMVRGFEAGTDDAILAQFEMTKIMAQSAGGDVSKQVNIDWPELDRRAGETKNDYHQRLLSHPQCGSIVLESQRTVVNYIQAGRPSAEDERIRQIMEIKCAFQLAISSPAMVENKTLAYQGKMEILFGFESDEDDE